MALLATEAADVKDGHGEGADGVGVALEYERAATVGSKRGSWGPAVPGLLWLDSWLMGRSPQLRATGEMWF